LQDAEPVKQIVRFLRSRCKKDEHTAQKLGAVLEGKKGRTGLIVSERLINVPLDLAPPLYQGLFDEINWATEDEVSHRNEGSVC
jgi:protein BCP1